MIDTPDKEISVDYGDESFKSRHNFHIEYYRKVDENLPPFDIKKAALYDYPTFVRGLYDKYTIRYVPTLDECKIMICRALMKDENTKEDILRLPWPDGVEKDGDTISDGYGYCVGHDVFGGDVLAVSRDGSSGISENGADDADMLLRLSEKFSKRLNDDELCDLNRFMVENFITIRKSALMIDLCDNVSFKRHVNNNDKLTPKENSIYKLYELFYNHDFSGGSYIEKLLTEVLPNIDKLVKDGWEDDANIKNKILASILLEEGISETANLIRSLLENQSVAEESEINLDRTMRLILGLDPNLKVHQSLESVYKEANFDNYPVSLETQKFRKNSLIRQLNQLGVNTDAEILDLGCGAGWLVGDLINAGYLRTKGFDISEANLFKARENYGDRFISGDWQELASIVSKGHLELVLSLGRTLPHSESEYGFRHVLNQVNLSLVENGYFIFDMPNPEIEGSEYKKRVDYYRDRLKEFGLKDTDLRYIYFIVDSPDGKNFYNRYVPTEEMIRLMLNKSGFLVKNVVREGIPGYDVDENMVFICQKQNKDFDIPFFSVFGDIDENDLFDLAPSEIEP